MIEIINNTKKKIIINFLLILIFKILLISQNSNKLDDEFLNSKNITSYIECLHCGGGNLGNALIILNNLINICENTKCKYILLPSGLEKVIKIPIYYKEKNITILPYSYKYKINICLELNGLEILTFRYKNKLHKNRMNLLKNEIIRNLPRYNASPDDLYINIRSGDIFKKVMHAHYAQPPLCFYQKIINDNKLNYKNFYIISNGKENPIVDELQKLYPKIKYIHGSPLEDASVLVNVYNLVLSVSSFSYSLIRLNDNLNKIFIYDIMTEMEKIFWYGTDYYFKFDNFIIYKMEPSLTYQLKMKGKWKNTKEQINLMIKEKCINNSFYLISKPKN